MRYRADEGTSRMELRQRQRELGEILEDLGYVIVARTRAWPGKVVDRPELPLDGGGPGPGFHHGVMSMETAMASGETRLLSSVVVDPPLTRLPTDI